jgi:hypothetical protein
LAEALVCFEEANVEEAGDENTVVTGVSTAIIKPVSIFSYEQKNSWTSLLNSSYHSVFLNYSLL